jgi:pimeloyl-ACP methyl ester carboxylesterase
MKVAPFTMIAVLLAAVSLVLLGAGPQTAKLQGLREWTDQGRFIEVNGNKIFIVTAGKAETEGHGVLIVHGFPGSSWGWSGVVPIVAERTKVVVPDMLGFGRSDKPQSGTFEDHYSLFKQADLYEAVAEKEGLTEVMLVIHDMGQTVGSELMKRHQEGMLNFKIRHAIVLNGSTLVNLVALAPIQEKALAEPDTVGPDKDMAKKVIEDGIAPSFGKMHPPSEQTLSNMADQILYNEGDRVFGRQLRYLPERKKNLQRWQAGIINFNGPVSMFWGELDSVALVEMADAWKDMQPKIELHKWPDVAHWPMIDVPDRVAKVILDRYWQ